MPAQPDRRRPRREVERGTLDQAEVRDLAERLFASEHERLRKIALRHGPTGADPEDVVQAAFDVFLRKFDLSEREAVGWLVTTTIRLAWRAIRTEERRREAPEPRPPAGGEDEQFVYRVAGEGDDPLERVLALECAAVRASEFRRLREVDRIVLVLGASGYQPREIAEMTGLSRRQVRRSVERANRALAQLDPDG